MATFHGPARLSEDEARAMIEGIRWPNGPECPHCASDNAVRLEGRATRPGVLKCRDCGKQFTVTVNTIMHRSKIPLSKWLIAFHLMCSSKKGISALRLQRELGLGSYQTAWHMERRIRYAMTAGGLGRNFAGGHETVTHSAGEYVRGDVSTDPVVGLV